MHLLRLKNAPKGNMHAEMKERRLQGGLAPGWGVTTTAVGVLSFALPRLRVARLALFLSFPFFLVFFFSVPVFACIADLANEKRIVQYEDALVFDLNTFVLQDSWTSFTKELLAKSRAVM
jgi:hypothetical protein